MKPALAVTNLSAYHRSGLGIENFNFTIPKGVVVGLLGPTGSGKSTLLGDLAHLIPRVGGDNTQLREANSRQPYTKTGWSLNRDGLYSLRKVSSRLRIEAMMQQVSFEDCEEIFEASGVMSLMDRRIGALSTGQRKKVSLAAAMLATPELLILDEPFNGLDPESIAWLKTTLRHYVQDGKSILVSSHHLSDAQDFVDQAILVHSGTIVADGPITELMRSLSNYVGHPAPAEAKNFAPHSDVTMIPNGWCVAPIAEAQLGLRCGRHDIPGEEIPRTLDFLYFIETAKGNHK